MAKQLLGREVTAAMNEKIKENVAKLQAKGITPTLGIIRVEQGKMIFPTKEVRLKDVKLWE